MLLQPPRLGLSNGTYMTLYEPPQNQRKALTTGLAKRLSVKDRDDFESAEVPP